MKTTLIHVGFDVDDTQSSINKFISKHPFRAFFLLKKSYIWTKKIIPD